MAPSPIRSHLATLPISVGVTHAPGLETAVHAYQAARKAYNDAFAVERAIRDEPRLAVEALMGVVRSVPPGDEKLQDVVFTDLAVSRRRADADEDDVA